MGEGRSTLLQGRSAAYGCGRGAGCRGLPSSASASSSL